MKIVLATIAAAAALTMTACETDEPMKQAEAAETTAPAEEPEPVEEPEPAVVTETVTEEAEPEPTPEPEPEPEEEPTLSDGAIEDVFVTLIRSEYPGMFLGVSDRDMIDLAKGVCGQFDIGQTFADVGLMGVESGYTPKQIGYFIGASVPAFCPEHEGVIP